MSCGLAGAEAGMFDGLMKAGIEVSDGLVGEETEAHSGLVGAEFQVSGHPVGEMGEGYCRLAREQAGTSRKQSGRATSTHVEQGRKRKRNDEDERDKVAARNSPPTLPGAANVSNKFEPIIFYVSSL